MTLPTGFETILDSFNFLETVEDDVSVAYMNAYGLFMPFYGSYFDSVILIS